MNQDQERRLGTAKLLAFSAAAIVGVIVLAGYFWTRYKLGEEQVSVERGRELATLLCSECHSLTDEAASPNAAAPPFRTLLEKLTIEGIEDQIAEGLLLGHEPMPQWQFSNQQVYDLTSFIISLDEG